MYCYAYISGFVKYSPSAKAMQLSSLLCYLWCTLGTGSEKSWNGLCWKGPLRTPSSNPLLWAGLKQEQQRGSHLRLRRHNSELPIGVEVIYSFAIDGLVCKHTGCSLLITKVYIKHQKYIYTKVYIKQCTTTVFTGYLNFHHCARKFVLLGEILLYIQMVGIKRNQLGVNDFQMCNRKVCILEH